MSSEPAHDEDEERDDTGRAAKAAALLGGIFTLGALVFYGTRPAFSVFVGAAIAVANLLTMRAIIRALIRPPEPSSDSKDTADETETTEQKRGADHAGAGRRGGVAWAVLAVFKMVILFGGIWILLTRGLVDPIALVVGYGVLPLGITLSAVWSSVRSP